MSNQDEHYDQFNFVRESSFNLKKSDIFEHLIRSFNLSKQNNDDDYYHDLKSRKALRFDPRKRYSELGCDWQDFSNQKKLNDTNINRIHSQNDNVLVKQIIESLEEYNQIPPIIKSQSSNNSENTNFQQQDTITATYELDKIIKTKSHTFIKASTQEPHSPKQEMPQRLKLKQEQIKKSQLELLQSIFQSKQNEKNKFIPQDPLKQLNLMNFEIKENISIQEYMEKMPISYYMENSQDYFNKIEFIKYQNTLKSLNQYFMKSSELNNQNIIPVSENNVLAIGYVFEKIEEFKCKNRGIGNITSIQIDKFGEYIICGYEKGAICFYEISNLKLLKKIDDISTFAIIFCSFYKENEKILVIDSDGTVFLIELTQKMLFWDYKYSKLLTKIAGIITSCSILYYSDQNSESDHNQTVVALASCNLVILIIIEPQIKVIHKMLPPTNLNNEQLGSQQIQPCVLWTKKIYIRNKFYKQSVLIIAWGCSIFMYKTNKFFNQKSQYELKSDPLLNISHNIIHFIQITPYLLIASTNDNKIIQINTITFDIQTLTNSEVQCDISSNLVVKNQYKIQSQTLTFNSVQRNIYLINQRKQIINLRLATLQECNKQLIAKQDWLNIFAIGITLYKTNKINFNDIPTLKQQQQKYFIDTYKALVNEFIIDQILTVENNDLCLRNKIFQICDFLLCIDQITYLLDHITSLLGHKLPQQLLLQAIEPVIVKGKLKKIDNYTFKQILQYFCNEDKKPVIHSLIVNLDLSAFDSSGLVQLCLIYICTQGNYDFMTPLVKFASNYQHLRNKNPEQSIKLIKLVLSYIKFIFLRKMFPNDFIPEEKWQYILLEIVQWIIIEQNLYLLLDMNPYLLIELLLMLYTPEIANIINNLSSLQVDVQMPLPLKYVRTTTQQQQMNSSNNLMKIAGYILQKLQPSYLFQIDEQNQSIFQLKSNFLCKYILNPKSRRAIPASVGYFMSMITIIGEYRLGPQDLFLAIQYFLINPFELKYAIEYFSVFPLEEIEIQTNNLLKRLMTHAKQDFVTLNYLNILIRRAYESPFAEIQTILLSEKKEFNKCVDIYLQCPKLYIKQKIFQFLEKSLLILNQEQDINGYRSLMQYILKNSTELVAINSQKMKKIILNFNKSEETNVIKYLEPYPKIQLDYLEELVQQRDQGKSVQKEYLLRYVELLCELDQEKLLLEIQVKDYPVDECLDICKKKQALEVEAFLLDRKGAFRESIKLDYKNILRMLNGILLIVNIIKLIQYNFNKIDSIKLQRPFKSCLRVCKQNSQLNDSYVLQGKEETTVKFDILSQLN